MGNIMGLIGRYLWRVVLFEMMLTVRTSWCDDVADTWVATRV